MYSVRESVGIAALELHRVLAGLRTRRLSQPPVDIEGDHILGVFDT